MKSLIAYICNDVTNLNCNKYISGAFGLGLMLLVILSITPKIYLHDIFANHTDISFHNHTPDPGADLQQQGYHCELFELIVPHEYLLARQLSVGNCIQYHKTFATFFPAFYIQNVISGFTGRGPPAHI